MGVVLIGFVYWIVTIVLVSNSLMKTASLVMLLYIIAVLLLVKGVNELLKGIADITAIFIDLSPISHSRTG